jgi:hypothetical protein
LSFPFASEKKCKNRNSSAVTKPSKQKKNLKNIEKECTEILFPCGVEESWADV